MRGRVIAGSLCVQVMPFRSMMENSCTRTPRGHSSLEFFVIAEGVNYRHNQSSSNARSSVGSHKEDQHPMGDLMCMVSLLDLGDRSLLKRR